MPQAVFTISGSIADFTRLDNIYKALKREADKGLTNWTLDAKVEYSEKQSDQKET